MKELEIVVSIADELASKESGRASRPRVYILHVIVSILLPSITISKPLFCNVITTKFTAVDVLHVPASAHQTEA